jgi:hypothetical protein
MKMKTQHNMTNANILMIKSLFDLTNKDIGEIVGVATSTVNGWTANAYSVSYRRASDYAAKKLMSMYSLELA